MPGWAHQSKQASWTATTIAVPAPAPPCLITSVAQDCPGQGSAGERARCGRALLKLRGRGGHIAFKHMLHATEHAVFALALPGDSPSSRRLSEIFMAGAD